MSKNNFWNFRNVSDIEGELLLYGYIAESSWWDDVVSSKKFAQDLKDLGDVKNITVRINSGGGDVFAGHAIYQMLKDHTANIIVKVEGLAASAASVVAMAGNEIIVPATSFLMIHNPSSVAWGEAKDFEKMAETLNVIKDGIINAYVAKTGKDKKTISKMMDDETWMTGEDAVKEGFADKVETSTTTSNKAVLNGNLFVVNNVSHDLSKYKTRPQLTNEQSTESQPEPSLVQRVLDFLKGAPQVPATPVPVANIINNQEVNEEMEIKNIDDLKKAYPELVNQIETAAATSAVNVERTRIQDIEKIAKNVDPLLVDKAKFTEPIDAKELAFQAMQLDGNKGNAYLANLVDDSNKSGAAKVVATPIEQKTEEEKKEATNKAVDLIAAGGDKRRNK
ncbi:MAG: Clp protease ClpP [Clostridia bacterium]|jgi:ATP-dependent Clp endopeptidase proteolytic subunit ClpP|nr:Clp protease ClpP [Clostridia bacterium]